MKRCYFKYEKRITGLVMVLAFIIAAFSGCGKDKAEENKTPPRKYISVGFSQVGAESDWRVANTDSICGTLTRENGFDLMYDDAQQKQDKQIIAIRNFVQQEVDCIVLAPVMEEGWDTVLQEAKDADIPVIVVDRMVSVSDKSLYTAWVGSDFKKEGRIACEWLNEYTKKKGIDPKDIHIVNVQGTLGGTAQIGRSRALKDASINYGWDILDQIPADYAKAKSKEVVTDCLYKYPELNVLYCENDNEALGAIEAVEEFGRKIGTDIANGDVLIISFDAAHSGLRMVREGKIALDVECNPLQGEVLEKLINDVEAGKRVEKYTYIEEKAFSSDDEITVVTVDGNEQVITPLTEEILRGREY